MLWAVEVRRHLTPATAVSQNFLLRVERRESGQLLPLRTGGFSSAAP